MNTEGKETPSENGQCSFLITLRSQNATVMRTNFHGLAIDNALVRLDFDKFLCSVCFDTKLQHNRKSCFHTWINLGIIAVLLGFVKQALDLRVRPSALRSYFNRKRHSVWGWIPISFLNKAIALVQSWHKGKDYFLPTKSFPNISKQKFLTKKLFLTSQPQQLNQVFWSQSF